ncbi:uncharacterized protein [Prorops nasuta]
MTLHWWMHWFWVTTHFIVIIGSPVPSSTEEPRVRIQNYSSPENRELTYLDSPSPKPSFRMAKAIGVHPQANASTVLERQSSVSQSPIMARLTAARNSSSGTTRLTAVSQRPKIDNSNPGSDNSTIPGRRLANNAERGRSFNSGKDSKITWARGSGKTNNRSNYEEEDGRGQASQVRNYSLSEVEDLTVLPLQEEDTRFRLVLNKSTANSYTPFTTTIDNNSNSGATISGVIEPQILVTAASILEGVSESTRLSRARSAFASDFQRDQVQEKGKSFDYENGDNGRGNTGNDTDRSSRSDVDIAAITGSCLATVVLLSTMGSLGFIVYRRRYLNPPQALNSDKCSNPDSSGYIDDSTIRDNSEEMYSLDNDSFLNSLEAMTIQNYWTDSVKHTKL